MYVWGIFSGFSILTFACLNCSLAAVRWTLSHKPWVLHCAAMAGQELWASFSHVKYFPPLKKKKSQYTFIVESLEMQGKIKLSCTPTPIVFKPSLWALKCATSFPTRLLLRGIYLQAFFLTQGPIRVSPDFSLHSGPEVVHDRKSVRQRWKSVSRGRNCQSGNLSVWN